jgi:hypothetical protein
MLWIRILCCGIINKYNKTKKKKKEEAFRERSKELKVKKKKNENWNFLINSSKTSYHLEK